MNRLEEDKIIWRVTRSGCFLVPPIGFMVLKGGGLFPVVWDNIIPLKVPFYVVLWEEVIQLKRKWWEGVMLDKVHKKGSSSNQVLHMP